jgi:hypothetical protein
MTPETLSCPYCNSRINLSGEAASGPRVRCPRCGDTFPRRAGSPTAGLNGTLAAGGGPDAADDADGRWSNRKLALSVLGAMAGIAVAAVIFVVVTQPFRRANDTRKTGPGVGLPGDMYAVQATPPAKLAALGYLPADTAAVAGLHVAELWQQPEGKKLLAHMQSSGPDLGLKLVSQKAGIKPQEIDHLVLGARPTEGLPQLTFVVQTVKEYNREALAKALGPARAEKYEGKPVYRFKAGAFAEGLLYPVADRTLLLHVGLPGVSLKDLAAIPRKPAGDPPAAVREALEKRLPSEALLWTAGSVESFPVVLELLKAVPDVPSEVGDTLEKVKSFAAGVKLEDGVALSAAVETKDEASARALAELLKRRGPKDERFKVAAPPGKADPSAPEALRRVLVQIRADEATVLDLLRQGTALLPTGPRR